MGEMGINVGTEHEELAPQDPEKNMDARLPEAAGRDMAELPKGYWTSSFFIGSYCAVGVGFAAGCGGFALIAPILPQINADIGPSANITWVGIVYALPQAIIFMLAGRLSDIFGRRWFFILGSIISLIGSILGATSQSVGMLIAAETLIGVGTGFQNSFFWVVSEIVPMKRRFIANSGLYLFTIPTNALGPKVALLIQANTSVHWRGSFYFLIALNAVSVSCWYFFYHPPTFNMLHTRRTAYELFKAFDFLGLFLFSLGLVLFLMGLNWGGSLYPWKSGQVLGTLISGAVVLIVFGFYETFAKLEEPYVPIELFRNFKYTSAAIWTGIGAMTYYAFGLIWPQAVTKLYTGLDEDSFTTLSGLVTMTFLLGQMTGPFIANWYPPKRLFIIWAFGGVGLLAAAAANPLNLGMTAAFIASGNFLTGMADGICIAMTTFPIRTQEEIGTAGGLSGSIRGTGSSIAVALYGTILANRLASTIPGEVGPVVLNAGLPSSSIPLLLAGFDNSSPVNNFTVPGLTDTILELAQEAYRVGNAQAYTTVFLSTLGFGGLGLILCWFTGGIDESQGDFVAGHIHNPKDTKVLEMK